VRGASRGEDKISDKERQKALVIGEHIVLMKKQDGAMLLAARRWRSSQKGRENLERERRNNEVVDGETEDEEDGR
jgi:hypothetical protein